jgi:hypothetical protein
MPIHHNWCILNIICQTYFLLNLCSGGAVTDANKNHQ